jgi:hypothetical protein
MPAKPKHKVQFKFLLPDDDRKNKNKGDEVQASMKIHQKPEK